MIITHAEAKKLLEAIERGQPKTKISLDLGKTETDISIENSEMVFPENQKLNVAELKKIIKKDTICFFIEDCQAKPISIFSDDTNNYYKLVPTGSWPTLEISGIRMHVTKTMTPKEDTEKKISFVSPCLGVILDTCTGLGYTAIWAARSADEVHTFERDANIIELEKINPWSEDLFRNNKIKTYHGDVFESIREIKDNSFDRIIHDPPRQALSNLLYSQEFYNQMFRVLKKGGKLYHYTGDPGSKTGSDIRAGIIKRLSLSGFDRIRRVFNGLVAERI